MTPEITNSAAATLVSTPALVEAFKALVAGALGGLLTHGLTRLRDRANLNSERRSLAAAAAAELRATWAKSLATERAREWDEGYTRDVVDWGDSSFDATPLVSAATAKRTRSADGKCGGWVALCISVANRVLIAIKGPFHLIIYPLAETTGKEGVGIIISGTTNRI